MRTHAFRPADDDILPRRVRRPLRSWSDRIDWALAATSRAALGGLAAVTLSGLVMRHTDLGDVAMALLGAAIALWDARRNGAL